MRVFEFWRGGPRFLIVFLEDFALPAGPASRVLGRRPSTLFFHIFSQNIGIIFNINARDNSTLGVALSDSPAGVAAWFLESRRSLLDVGLSN